MTGSDRIPPEITEIDAQLLRWLDATNQIIPKGSAAPDDETTLDPSDATTVPYGGSIVVDEILQSANQLIRPLTARMLGVTGLAQNATDSDRDPAPPGIDPTAVMDSLYMPKRVPAERGAEESLATLQEDKLRLTKLLFSTPPGQHEMRRAIEADLQAVKQKIVAGRAGLYASRTTKTKTDPDDAPNVTPGQSEKDAHIRRLQARIDQALHIARTTPTDTEDNDGYRKNMLSEAARYSGELERVALLPPSDFIPIETRGNPPPEDYSTDQVAEILKAMRNKPWGKKGDT